MCVFIPPFLGAVFFLNAPPSCEDYEQVLMERWNEMKYSTICLHIRDATAKSEREMERFINERLMGKNCSAFLWMQFLWNWDWRNEGEAGLMLMHMGHFCCAMPLAWLYSRDLNHLVNKKNYCITVKRFLKDREGKLLHTDFSCHQRTWIWVWIHSQGVCFLFTVPRALHTRAYSHRLTLNSKTLPDMLAQKPLNNHI